MFLKALCIIVAVVFAVVAFAAASSEVGASNAVRAIPVPFKLALSAGFAVLGYGLSSYCLPLIASIPRDRRCITWTALAGWALACFALALLLSTFDAIYLAFGVGRHARLLTPPDWIISRALIGGSALTAIPWMMILRPQAASTVSVHELSTSY